MKVITTNGRLRILPGDAGIGDLIKPGVYQLLYDDNTGPFLQETSLQQATELFGPMKGKEEKVFEAYDRHKGNTGIILNGPKGLGKSLFSRRLAHIAISRSMPVILVDSRARCIADFVAAVDQQVMYLLDEFEKHFKIKDLNGDEDTGAQLQFLSMLDGTDGAKRLVVITCNDTYDLSQFFLDRPGRFYYNFTFPYPNAAEAETFIRYQGLEGHDEEVKRMSTLGTLMGFSYDALAAIVEELKAGYTLDETLEDLNVAGRCSDRTADVKITFASGEEAEGYTDIDFSDDKTGCFYIYSTGKRQGPGKRRYNDGRMGELQIKTHGLHEIPGDKDHIQYTVHEPDDNVVWDWWDASRFKDGSDDTPPSIKEIQVKLRPFYGGKTGLGNAMCMFC